MLAKCSADCIVFVHCLHGYNTIKYHGGDWCHLLPAPMGGGAVDRGGCGEGTHVASHRVQLQVSAVANKSHLSR